MKKTAKKNAAQTAADSTKASVAEHGAHVAPGEGGSGKQRSQKKNATKRANGAKVGKARVGAEVAKERRAKKSAKPRESSKKAQVLALLERKDGATLGQMMKATGWQAHSVRGFLSGALGKKMELSIASEKAESGERVYRLAK